MNPRLEARVLKLRQRRPYGEWTPAVRLAEPIHAIDSTYLARAMSIVHDIAKPGGRLTPAQARDVITWHERHTRVPQRPSAMHRFLANIRSIL